MQWFLLPHCRGFKETFRDYYAIYFTLDIFFTSSSNDLASSYYRKSSKDSYRSFFFVNPRNNISFLNNNSYVKFSSYASWHFFFFKNSFTPTLALKISPDFIQRNIFSIPPGIPQLIRCVILHEIPPYIYQRIYPTFHLRTTPSVLQNNFSFPSKFRVSHQLILQ